MAFWVGWAFRAEVVSALESAACIGRVEVHLFIRITNVTADSLRCYVGKTGNRRCGFDDSWPGIILCQPSPGYAPDSQHPSYSLLGHWLDVS